MSLCGLANLLDELQPENQISKTVLIERDTLWSAAASVIKTVRKAK